jgi:glycosyltransferase involved in cell wall biosynthesis
MERRPPRICVIRHFYFPEDPRVRKAVEALVNRGYEVDVVCLRNEGEAARASWRSATIYRLPVRHRRRGPGRYFWEYGIFFILASGRVAALHARRRYDVVQVHTLPDALVFAALIPRLSGARVLLDMHELMPEFAAEKFRFRGTRLLVRLILLMERRAARFADRLLAVSPAQAAVIEHRVGKACAFSPNVPDDTFLGHSEVHVPRDEIPTLISHALALTEGHGVQLLVKALPHVLENHSVRAIVVGDGAYLDRLQHEATEQGVEEHVEFTGRVPFTAVPQLIARCTAGVITFMPNPQMEVALPNKLFEYAALGLPIIAPDLPGMRSCFDDEAVVYFRAGDHVDLAEKIVRLLSDPLLQKKTKQRAREAYNELRWEVTSRTYVGLIDQLVAGRTVALPTAPRRGFKKTTREYMSRLKRL